MADLKRLTAEAGRLSRRVRELQAAGKDWRQAMAELTAFLEKHNLVEHPPQDVD